ncbi:hypothetical protein FOMPIDRAFT_1114818 [Fomitopsis schrenkii]|uniref:ditrans,polycis-polyprenyl diphosphate synthase [(2E,6E)-farnesyldiphosphate specific] n=1 Tax=Fomitopsis schrenkii TaxID=2126942 RepID=S8G0D5_FOMSC|nr:hypothetical protein FOMPIDRAFT_1114818 [Fomitopsis schrenkii]
MSWLASLILALFHVVHWLVTSARRFLAIPKQPQPLVAQRSKLPTHLALLLVLNPHCDRDAVEETLVESVERAVTWCRAAGINRLTVYDREGFLSTLSLDIRKRLVKTFATPSNDSDLETELEYPLTPPSSDDSDSRPLSPDSEVTPFKLCVTSMQIPGHAGKARRRLLGVKSTTRRRRPTGGPVSEPTTPAPITLHILSRKAGKPAIAEVANALLRRRVADRPLRDGKQLPVTSEAGISSLLQGDSGFPEPDLMLVHHIHPNPTSDLLDLHGFPPWQIRLTEFGRDESVEIWWRRWRHPHSAGKPLNEIEFRRALDTYAAAEMRLGK